MERIAIFPGSFDPFTRGHAALVDEALNLFDRVIIGIGNNFAKKGLLTVENRKRLIDDIYAGNPRVEARIYSGLTGEFAEQVAACAIIRGVRNTTDFEYERTMEATNHRIYPRSRPSCSSRRPYLAQCFKYRPPQHHWPWCRRCRLSRTPRPWAHAEP